MLVLSRQLDERRSQRDARRLARCRGTNGRGLAAGCGRPRRKPGDRARNPRTRRRDRTTAAAARPQRELRARAARAPHARRRRRLHAAGRRRSRARVHRLDDRPAAATAASGSRRPCTIAARRRCSATPSRPAAASRTASACSTSSRAHPSTARHIAFKLAQRFVSDTPPPALVDRAAATFPRRPSGNLREVVRDHRHLARVLRARGVSREGEDAVRVRRRARCAQPAPRCRSGSCRWSARSRRLGMPLYLCQPPTGYDETAEAWVSSGALVNRMNFARGAARGDSAAMRGVAAHRSQPRRMFASTTATSRKPRLRQTSRSIGSPEFQNSQDQGRRHGDQTRLSQIERHGDGDARLRAVVSGADRRSGRRRAASCSSRSSSAARSTGST